MPASSIYSSGSSTHFSSNSSTSTTHQNQNQKTKQTFPFAYPPPLKTPHCLRRFAPNRLLQIQQLQHPTSTRQQQRQRHIPILEIWQPSIFNTRVGKQTPKLGSGDVYVTQCEGYLHLSPQTKEQDGNGSKTNADTETENDAVERTVVSVLTHDSRITQDESKSMIYFADGVAWEASIPSPGVYRVSFADKVLEWEKDPGQGQGQGGKFVLRVEGQRRVRIARMSRVSVEVGPWGRGVRSYLRDGLVSDSFRGEDGEDGLDARLCTLILTSGVWVAGQEGWINTS